MICLYAHSLSLSISLYFDRYTPFYLNSIAINFDCFFIHCTHSCADANARHAACEREKQVLLLRLSEAHRERDAALTDAERKQLHINEVREKTEQLTLIFYHNDHV
jgi:hypothetical protein